MVQVLLLLLMCLSPLAHAQNPFFDAVRKHDTGTARSLLSLGKAVPDQFDSLGATPLHVACWEGDTEMAYLLLEYGAQVNIRHKEAGSTPLHYAVITDRPEIVKLLLDRDADVHARYRSGQSPLHLAANRGYHAIAKLLVERGADVNARDDSGARPLDEAVWKGSAEVTRFLLENGSVLPQAKDTHSGEALHPLNAQRHNPRPAPLHTAAVRGHAEVVAVLLDAGADPNAVDEGGATALDEAIRFRHRGVLEVLLRRGARLDEPGSPGKRLRDAVMRGQADLVALLIENGADFRSLSETGSTALHDAALRGNVEVLRVLLGHGFPVDSPNAAGATALHDAALAGNLPVVRFLLEKGADLQARDAEDGATALHHAASWGRAEVLRYLLEQGADPQLKTKSGKTALEVALDANQERTAEALRSAAPTP
ncbi:MAG: ankyrin repeat domain-containing protein [Bryobacterales bacterium]|nr:ankyrin repeat domain-containing protein [Bryobacterales bacterium]